jgi:hypothetical protein
MRYTLFAGRGLQRGLQRSLRVVKEKVSMAVEPRLTTSVINTYNGELSGHKNLHPQLQKTLKKAPTIQKLKLLIMEPGLFRCGRVRPPGG